MKRPHFIALAALAAFPVLALAQEAAPFVPLTNLPGIGDAAASETLPAFFNSLYKLCIGAAAVIAVIQIMRAGMYFMFNKGSIAHNEKGKKLITDSILGLLLVLSPTIVFGIINPDILDLKLDFAQLSPGELASDPSLALSIIVRSNATDPIGREDLGDPEDLSRVQQYETTCRERRGTVRFQINPAPVRCPNESEGTRNPGCRNAQLHCDLPSILLDTPTQLSCNLQYETYAASTNGQCPTGYDVIQSSTGCCAGVSAAASCCAKPRNTSQPPAPSGGGVPGRTCTGTGCAGPE